MEGTRVTDSCFVSRLSHYLTLTASERTALAQLEASPEALKTGEVLFEEGVATDCIALVQSGWLTSSSLLADGQRQILRVHLAGDLAGVTGLAWADGAFTVAASLDTVVCRFPREHLSDLFERHPRLAALFFAMAMAETVDLCDRLKAVGRTNGKARLAQFFLSTLARNNITGRAGDTVLPLPLTQTDLADAVGLTNIHVNRLLRELTEDGLIQRGRGTVTMLDVGRLVDLSQYTNRFARLDTSWFPPAA